MSHLKSGKNAGTFTRRATRISAAHPPC